MAKTHRTLGTTGMCAQTMLAGFCGMAIAFCTIEARSAEVDSQVDAARCCDVQKVGDIHMRAPGVRIFETGGHATTFKASVGFDEAIKHLKEPWGPGHIAKTRMGFRVWGDGVKLADTGLLRPKDGVKTLTVDVRGRKVIAVESVDGGYWLGAPALLSHWRDMSFAVSKPNCVSEDTSGRLVEQFGILTPKADGAPRFTGPAVYGARPGNPILFRVPVVGAQPIRMTVEGLDGDDLKGMSFDGQRRILSGTISKPGTYRLRFLAKNAKGSAEREFSLVVGDKIALTPPMGWTSWNAWRGAITDKVIRDTARTINDSGLADYGWAYVNLDDCWQRREKNSNADNKGPVRDNAGRILPKRSFPDMKALTDYIHGFGLKAGLYSSPGRRTCQLYEGSLGHEAQDARTWCEWGFDYIKYDWCTYTEHIDAICAAEKREITLDDRIKPYALLYATLKGLPRDFVYSFSGGAGRDKAGANLWRTCADLKDSWGACVDAALSAERCHIHAHPGCWPDPDMLIVGVMDTGDGAAHPTLLTPNEQYSHLTMWAVLNAPLLIGCQMDKLDAFTLGLLTNVDVIDIDQDVSHPPAKSVKRTETEVVYVKELSGDRYAIAAINLAPFAREVSLDFAALGLPARLNVRDAWRQRELGVVQGRFSTQLPPHAPLLLVAEGEEVPVPCPTCPGGLR